VRIPGHADQRSGVMVISVPGSCRSGFRDDGDQDSGMMPIKKASDPGMMIGFPGIP
jgi:hypothetical protein